MLAGYLLLMPALAMWLCRYSRIARALGPVVFAYLFGILLSQWPISGHTETSSLIRDLSIPLAIPLLLFTLDVRTWLREARAAVLSFSLCIAALLIMALSAGLLFSSLLAQSAEIAGMLTGMYSGGAPNMAVVHRAMEASPELYLQVSAVDMMAGAVYFLFLITVSAPLFGLFLKPQEPAASRHSGVEASADRSGWPKLGLALLAATAIVAASVGMSVAILDEAAVAPVMLAITTLAIACSFWKPLRQARLSYPAGYYLVLVFCCAIGSQVDVSLLGSGVGMILAMLLTIMLGTVVLHLLLARLFGIDRDTAIITQTAALYGPPFVPPVAGALRNPAMLLSGLTTGLVGYALGNYLGIGVGLFLRQ